MKPLHVIISILFLVLATYVITRSERTVRNIQGSYFNLVSPVIKTGSNFDLKIQRFNKEVQTSTALEKRLEGIYSEFGRLQATGARYKQIEEENTRLRSALELQKRNPFELVASTVLTRSPSTWWETITINKGEDSGIATQFPIISEHGLVGKVDRVWNDIATVLLITDSSCFVSARVEGTPEFGIVSGYRGKYGEEALLKLKYLSKDISTAPGTRVVTSGKGGVFPDNIEIGTIISIEKGPLYAEAILKPSFSLTDSDLVFSIITTEQ